jgi:hypothetical protein
MTGIAQSRRIEGGDCCSTDGVATEVPAGPLAEALKRRPGNGTRA